MSLANETDGIAIVNTNDLSGGMKQIADDLAAYYVLGYYTTNTKFDGGVRNIKVRLQDERQGDSRAAAVPRADAGRDRRAGRRTAAVRGGKRRRSGPEPARDPR